MTGKESGHLIFSLTESNELPWLLTTADGFEMRKRAKAEIEAKREARRLAPLLARAVSRLQRERRR
jgi:hypothetical protein